MSKFMDTLMGIMGLDDLEAPVEEGQLDRDEITEENEGKKRIRLPKLSKAEKEEETLPKMQTSRPQYSGYTKNYQSESSSPRSRVVNMGGVSHLNMVIVQPTEYSDGRDIVNHLKARKPVIVNLELLDKVMAKKVVDFLSGATYANHGNMRKVSKGTFLIVPNGVDMMGELMLEEFEDGRMYF